MKRLILGLLIFFVFCISNAYAKGKEITIDVKGMVCSLCAQGIEKKLSAEPAVETVKVSLKNKQVTLVLKDGKELSDRQIKQILKDAGYSVSEIIRH